MKKIYSRYRWLIIFLAGSIVIAISYLLSDDLSIIPSSVRKLFDFAYQISLGYIINFFFFIMNIYLPQLNAERKAAIACELPIVSLMEEIRSV